MTDGYFMRHLLQGITLLRALWLGFAAGVLYELLRVLRRQSRAGVGQTALYDAVFWAVVLFAVFEFQLVLAAGESRLYVLAGLAAGFFAELWLTGRPVRCVWRTALGLPLGLLQRAAAAAKGLLGWLQKRKTIKRIVVFLKNFAKKTSIFHGNELK